ncbi:MAG TPA: bacterial proteasome activator family protein [Dermatophilaceae bacterium]|nr:bacterial proteasome activator family protein [Dermatophilaceae bacterium]
MSESLDEQHGDERQGSADDNKQERVVVVSQDGMGVVDQPKNNAEARDPADLVEHPGKVMRIASMIKQLLEEVRSAPLDEAGRTRLAEIHRRSISELEEGLAPELIEELERITLPFNDEAPSDAELRIAQAQLVGWLEGLFHGIQAALFAQQMAAQQQLQNMRRALPQGESGQSGGYGESAGSVSGTQNRTDPRDRGSTGQYL